MSFEGKCDICMEGELTNKSVPSADGISCIRCEIAMCDECYDLSVKLYGFLGDKNLVLPKSLKRIYVWPYNEYFPEDRNGFKTTRGCIECMTDKFQNSNQFGPFQTLVLKQKSKNKGIQNFI